MGTWCISTFKVKKLEFRGDCQGNKGFRKTGGFLFILQRVEDLVQLISFDAAGCKKEGADWFCMSPRDRARSSLQEKDILMSGRADLPKQTAIQGSYGVSSFGHF